MIKCWSFTTIENSRKLAYLASFEDIKANDFNLNIPRYVDTSEEEEEIDLKQLSMDIKDTNQKIKDGNRALLSMMRELTFNSAEIKRCSGRIYQGI